MNGGNDIHFIKNEQTPCGVNVCPCDNDVRWLSMISICFLYISILSSNDSTKRWKYSCGATFSCCRGGGISFVLWAISAFFTS